MIHNWLYLFFVFYCSIGVSLNAQQPVPSADYTGSRSTSTTGEFTTGGTWTSGLKIAWNISYSSSTKLWTYTYTITTASGSSLNSTGDQFYIEVAPKSQSYQYVNKGTTTLAQGPTLETSIGNEYDIEYTNSTTSTMVVSFTAQFAPVWGDFYFTNGSTYSTNSSAGTPSTSGSNINDYIAVPAGAVSTPDLCTWLILTVFLVPVVILKRRADQKRQSL